MHQSDVRATLRRIDGQLVFDPTRNRSATVSAEGTGENAYRFKSEVTVTPDNLILNKVYDVFGTHSRKAYSVSEFSGDGISTLRFLQGAYKDLNVESGQSSGGFETATEYRDTFYAAAPTSELISARDEVDLASDAFYQSEPDAEFDSNGASCSANADIELTLDMANPTLQGTVAACEGERLEGMDFCRDDEIAAAEQQFFQSCIGQPG